MSDCGRMMQVASERQVQPEADEAHRLGEAAEGDPRVLAPQHAQPAEPHEGEQGERCDLFRKLGRNTLVLHGQAKAFELFGKASDRTLEPIGIALTPLGGITGNPGKQCLQLRHGGPPVAA